MHEISTNFLTELGYLINKICIIRKSNFEGKGKEKDDVKINVFLLLTLLLKIATRFKSGETNNFSPSNSPENYGMKQTARYCNRNKKKLTGYVANNVRCVDIPTVRLRELCYSSLSSCR